MKTILDMENSGLKVMLADERIDSMRLMYDLFRRVEGGTKNMIETVCCASP
jgi:hypothetical protein